MRIFSALLSCAVATGAPLIDRGGVVNAASLTPGPLPGGAIARGSIFAVLGRDLGSSKSTSVQVRSSGAAWDAKVLSVRANRIDAIMPSEVPAGPATVIVTANGQSGAAQISVVPRALGFFPVDRLTKARRGEAVTLMATGLGPPQDLALEIFAGGERAEILSAGPDPSAPGRDRIILRIPARAPTGCYVPVQARLTGYIPSNVVTLGVEPEPLNCFETEEVRSGIETGGRAGIALLFRGALLSDLDPNETIESTLDGALVSFRLDSGGARAATALVSLPPPGACTVFSGWLDIGNIESSLRGDLLAQGSSLDAGAHLILAGRSGKTPFRRLEKAPEIYFGRFGGALPGTSEPALPPALDPGSYSLSGAGGRDVGEFKINLEMGRPVVWTNRNQAGSVDRERGVVIEWSGGNPGSPLAIAAINIDHRTHAAAAFLCIAPIAHRRFTVPELATQSLPLSRLQKDQSLGFLFVGALSPHGPRRFSASGLQAAVGFAGSFSGRTAVFR